MEDVPGDNQVKVKSQLVYLFFFHVVVNHKLESVNDDQSNILSGLTEPLYQFHVKVLL